MRMPARDCPAPRAGAYRVMPWVRYGDKIGCAGAGWRSKKNASTALPWHSTRTEAPRGYTENSYLQWLGFDDEKGQNYRNCSATTRHLGKY